MSACTIPVADAAALAAGDPAALEALRVAFGEFGILHLAGHGIPERLLDELYASFLAFCAAPESEHAAITRPDTWYQRGWMPSQTEIAVAAGGQPDFKECYFNCCTELTEEDRLLFPELNAAPVWPAGHTALPESYTAIALELQRVGEGVLAACERALDLAPDTLLEGLAHGPHVTRVLRYLPLETENVDAGFLWGENHTDFCAMTLLPGGRFLGQDDERIARPEDGSGLFQTTRAGELVPGTPPAGCIGVQIGQQLEVLTGGTLLATPHEIRAPRIPGLSRLSTAHFMHLNTSRTVFPLEAFRSEEAVRRYRPPVLAGTYDTKILVDIGLAPPEALDRLGYSNQDRIRPQKT